MLNCCFPPTQIPEYCHSLDEPDVLDNAFELIFAFDEIVALGYRENVNLAQIRTFTEMDSHEEKVYEAMRRVSTVSPSPFSPLSLPVCFSHLSLPPSLFFSLSLSLFQELPLVFSLKNREGDALSSK